MLEKQYLKEGWNRNKILEEINNAGFPAGSGSCGEMYLEKAFKDNGYLDFKRLKNAKNLSETSIMLLVHPTITRDEITEYANSLRLILLKASR